MSSRKSIKLPIIVTILIICVLVFLFMNIKQTVVVCKKTTSYNKVVLEEVLTTQMDGKKITGIDIKRTITIDKSYPYIDKDLESFKDTIKENTAYLKDKSSVVVDNNKTINHIELNNNITVLLDNISFIENNGHVLIVVDPNTKSKNVISLSIGDNYTDGELMQFFTSKGYSCK